jgi:hypothetical protein
MVKLITPDIQPDEWIGGYFERLAIWNSCENAESFFKKHHAQSNRISFTADILGITTQQLIQQFSLLPAYRSIVAQHSEVEHGDASFPSLIKRNCLKLPTENLHLCSQCQKEDIDYHGFIYVRRYHQLYGSEWCQKHGVNLSKVLPKNVDQVVTRTFESLVEKQSPYMRHPVIERFMHISDAMLYRKIPVHGDHVSNVLSTQAENISIRFSKDGLNKPLSDLAIESLPHEWLYRYFPAIEKKRTGEFIPAIDGTCVFRLQNHTAVNYILAASLLFENPDDALNLILTKQEIPQARYIIRRPDGFWNSNELFDLYIKHKGNCTSLTEEIGGEYDNNRENLVTHGLPPISGLSNATIKAFLDFQSGTPISALSKRGGVKIEKLEALLRTSSPRFINAVQQLSLELLSGNRKVIQSVSRNQTTLTSDSHNSNQHRVEKLDTTISDVQSDSRILAISDIDLHT